MGKYYNIKTGEKHNRLTIVKEVEKNKNCRMVLVLCNCGKEKIVGLSAVVNGYTKSCGCLQKETMNKILGKHHLCNDPLYDIYYDIKKRCYNKKTIGYKNYGGRGIIMCNEWIDDVVAFINWGYNNGYENNLQIDRINNDGNYTPVNCRWVSRHENKMNRRNTIYLEYKGERKTMYDFALQFGMEYKLLKDRIFKLKWDVQIALETKKITPHGYKKCLLGNT